MATGKVFVSYSRDDAGAVLKLVEDLRSAGVDVWLDQTDIPSGRRWDEAIEAALGNCEQLIAVLSEASVTSQNVMDEVSYAIDEGKSVIPVVIRSCKIPLRLRRLQYVDLTSEYESRVARLVASLTGGPPPSAVASPGREAVRISRKGAGAGWRAWAGNSRILKGGIAAAVIVVAAAIVYRFVPASSEAPPNSSSALVPVQVWKIGSPHEGDTPDPTLAPDLQGDAKTLGVELQVRSFPAQGFAAEFFEAFDKHGEPDVLVIDNFGILEGITTARGNFAGITSSRRVKEALVFVDGSLDALQSGRGGWQMLLTTSRNHEAAKSLALRRPHCETAQTQARNRRSALANEIQRDVHKAIVDSAMFNTRPGSDFNLSMCGLWGNRNLAFVNAAVVFEEQQRIGWQNVLVMMARRGDSWTLLNIGGNVDVITELDDSIDLADDGLARPFDNSVLRVLAPADGVSSTRDAKPQLEWQWRGGPGQLAFYLLESQFESQNEWSGSHFGVVRSSSDPVTLIAPFGVGAQPHRWRVWAVGPSGALVQSEWRVINYTN